MRTVFSINGGNRSSSAASRSTVSSTAIPAVGGATASSAAPSSTLLPPPSSSSLLPTTPLVGRLPTSFNSMTSPNESNSLLLSPGVFSPLNTPHTHSSLTSSSNTPHQASSISSHSTHSNGNNTTPAATLGARSCHKKLGFDASTRPTLVQKSNSLNIGASSNHALAPLHSLTPMHAHIEQPSAAAAAFAQAAFNYNSHGNGTSGAGGAMHVGTASPPLNGLQRIGSDTLSLATATPNPLSSSSLLHHHPFSHHQAPSPSPALSTQHHPFRGDGPSPFMPGMPGPSPSLPSPSPSLSSFPIRNGMNSSISLGLGQMSRESQSVSQSPMFVPPPSVFSPRNTIQTSPVFVDTASQPMDAVMTDSSLEKSTSNSSAPPTDTPSNGDVTMMFSPPSSILPPTTPSSPHSHQHTDSCSHDHGDVALTPSQDSKNTSKMPHFTTKIHVHTTTKDATKLPQPLPVSANKKDASATVKKESSATIAGKEKSSSVAGKEKTTGPTAKTKQSTSKRGAKSEAKRESPLPPAVKRESSSSPSTSSSSTPDAVLMTPAKPLGERHSSRISAAEAKAAALAASNPSPVQTPPPSAEKAGCKGCNCKKSRCLKLYCECFARQGYCNSDCKCNLCLNTEDPDHVDERAKAIDLCIQRDPKAFFRAPDDETTENKLRGCNCKKSACQKKYCECYQAGVPCTIGCKCVDCKNGKPHSHDEDEDYKSASPVPTKTSARKKAALITAGGSGASERTQNSAIAKKKRPISKLETVEKETQHRPLTAKRKASTTAAASTRETSSSPPVDEEISIHASRSKQREKHAAQRARENNVADEENDTRATTPRGTAISPATASSSNASSTMSAPNLVATGISTRTTALQPSQRQTLANNGASFQSQLTAHQAQLASEKGMMMSDEFETDSDFTSHAGDSLLEAPHGMGSMHTPVKHMRQVPGQSASSQRPTGATGFAALQALVDVASPSPRLQKTFRSQSSGLMSPVSPMGVSPLGLGTAPSLNSTTPILPGSKLRHRALTFNGGGISNASPLPPLFSPLRQVASPNLSSTNGIGAMHGSQSPYNHSISPAPGLNSSMGAVLQQQHQSMQLQHSLHSSGPHNSSPAMTTYRLLPQPNSTSFRSLSGNSSFLLNGSASLNNSVFNPRSLSPRAHMSVSPPTTTSGNGNSPTNLSNSMPAANTHTVIVS